MKGASLQGKTPLHKIRAFCRKPQGHALSLLHFVARGNCHHSPGENPGKDPENI